MPRPTTCPGPRSAIGGGDVVVPDALPATPITRRHLATAVDVIAEKPDEHVSTVLPNRDAPIAACSTHSACSRGPEPAAEPRDVT